jgi:hypothetical protein
VALFKAVSDWFASLSKRKKQEKEWASYDYGKPAKPDNLIPLDPKDPWKT